MTTDIHTTEGIAMSIRYGVTSDYDYNATHKRDRIDVWSGAFYSVWEAVGYSLPSRNGYMLETYNGDRIKVLCPIRDDEAYIEVDTAVSKALNHHFGA